MCRGVPLRKYFTSRRTPFVRGHVSVCVLLGQEGSKCRTRHRLDARPHLLAGGEGLLLLLAHTLASCRYPSIPKSGHDGFIDTDNSRTMAYKSAFFFMSYKGPLGLQPSVSAYTRAWFPCQGRPNSLKRELARSARVNARIAEQRSDDRRSHVAGCWILRSH